MIKIERVKEILNEQYQKSIDIAASDLFSDEEARTGYQKKVRHAEYVNQCFRARGNDVLLMDLDETIDFLDIEVLQSELIIKAQKKLGVFE